MFYATSLSAMENFRFILENPHPNANNKQRKRARLVTACDSCRVKKIKCQQTSPNGRCEACKIAKIPCLFGDRDRYQAERGVSCAWSPPVQDIGPLAMPSSSTLIDLSFRQPRAAYLPYATGRSPKQRSDSMSISETSSGLSSTSTRESPPATVSSHSSAASKSFVQTQYQQQQTTGSLFGSNYTAFDNIPNDPSVLNPQQSSFAYPQRMHSLTTLFFDTIGYSFPFLDRVDILHRIERKTCSPILANCIASLALRYTSNPEDLPASIRFYEMAKNLTANVVSVPSIEALHALICITWTEYGMGQMDNFDAFSRMAITMCLDLGLGHETTIRVAIAPEIRTRLRLTWWTVVCVADVAASWAIGRPAVIDLTKYDTELPQGDDERIVLFRSMTQLYLLRNRIGRAVESYLMDRSNSSLDWSISELQSGLQQVIDSLPFSLTFNLENLARARECGFSAIFIQTHIFIHAMTILMNQPSLLAPHDLSVNLQSTQIEKARSSVKYLTEIIMVQDVLPPSPQEPFMDLPLLIAIRFLMMDVENSQINSTNAGKAWQMVLLDVLKDTLVSISSQFGNNESFETLLQAKGGYCQSKVALSPNTQVTGQFTVSDSNLDWFLRPAPTSDDSSSDTSGSLYSSSRELSPFTTPDSIPSREPPLVHTIEAYSMSTSVQSDLIYDSSFLTMSDTSLFHQYGNCINTGQVLSTNHQPGFEILLHSERDSQKPLAYQHPPSWPPTS